MSFFLAGVQYFPSFFANILAIFALGSMHEEILNSQQRLLILPLLAKRIVHPLTISQGAGIAL
jgi:hypothetical protein